jgi:hypothetical protein
MHLRNPNVRFYIRLTKTSGKIVDAIMHPHSKFEHFISNIDAEVKKLQALRDAGHVAQTTDMMELMSETSLSRSISLMPREDFLIRCVAVVARMYQNFESQSNAIGTSMEMVNTKLENLIGLTTRKPTLLLSFDS